MLTHWGLVTHTCFRNLIIIGSDNGLATTRHQAIIWTNAGILWIGPLRTNFDEILREILTFSFKKIRLNVSSVKRRPFCLGLNVSIHDMITNIPHNLAYYLDVSYNPLITQPAPGLHTLHAGNQYQHVETQTKWPALCRQHLWLTIQSHALFKARGMHCHN